MLAYVMVGTTNMERSIRFYDATLRPLGLSRTEDADEYTGYAPPDAPEKIEFYVTLPYNGSEATAGNGTMIALGAETLGALDEFHAVALANGGTDEGKPGPRPADSNIHYAYARDPDGNKICASCEPPS